VTSAARLSEAFIDDELIFDDESILTDDELNFSDDKLFDSSGVTLKHG
jgi:hypothetical protein